jgi:hypothetical protein
MITIHAPSKPLEMRQKSATDSRRVFKLSLKGIPPVNAEMWAQMQVAARMPSQGRRYPEIAEVPDAST